MSTSNPTTGKSKFARLLRLFLAGLASAYVCLILASSYLYTYKILHVPCLPGLQEHTGLQSISLTTADGIPLRGWYRAPQNGTLVLLLGGLGATRDTMLPEAEMLMRHGFGVLLADTRSCAGALGSLGYFEVADLRAMADYAAAQPGVEKLGALGFSAGGVTVLLGAAEMPQIRGVVAMGNYPNLLQEITYSPAPTLSPEWELQQLVDLSYGLLTVITPAQVSPIDAIPKISPRAVLILHGELEAPRTQPERQYQAAGEPRSLWIVPGAGHGGYLQAQPQEFERRVVAFFSALP